MKQRILKYGLFILTTIICVGLLWINCFLTGDNILATIITNIIVPLVVSIWGTFIALRLIFEFLRPQIEINKDFALNDEGKLEFCFKNNTYFRIYDIQILLKNVSSENGIDETEENIELEDVSITHIIGKKEGTEGQRTICVLTKDVASDKMSHLKLIVSAQHPLSGVTGVTTQDYEYANVIRGTFEDGKIVPENNNN